MKVYPLPHEEIIATGANLKVVVTHEDLTGAVADATQTLQLFTVRAGQIVTGKGFHMPTPLKEVGTASNNSTAVIVGDGGDTDRFLTTTELNENASEVPTKTAPVAATDPMAYTGDDTVDAIFTPDGSNTLASLDTGEIHFYFHVSDLALMA